MNFVGEGCFKGFVAAVSEMLAAFDNCAVRQENYLGEPSSMRIRNGKWEIDIGN
jgi:hypothetical protein